MLFINIKGIKTTKEHIWTYVVNKKALNNPEYVLHLRFFKVAAFYFDDSFAHLWHSLNHINGVVTLNGFQLTGVLCQELICGIFCLFDVRPSVALCRPRVGTQLFTVNSPIQLLF